MAKPALSDELIALWSDRWWRLENLYYVQDEYGAVYKFKLRPAQRKLLEEMHFLNLILKARQLGFSTFILIPALDCCLFNDHFAAGLIADTMKNAQNLLKRIKFAYDRLPDPIKVAVPLITDNSTEMEFGNGSSIEVGVSLRSGTKNLLHISEYGKICAGQPEKAKEVKSGALNTLAPRQLAFIESTAEGKAGDFYDKTKQAGAILDAGRREGELEYRFHFFPWFDDPKYASAQPFLLTKEDIEYFDKLKKEHGIVLTAQQQWWYAGKKREQGDDMLKEYPSTADEAFEGAMDGAYYGKDMRNLRQRGRIGRFPFVLGIVVNTFWDFGLGDAQTIWLHQEVAGENNFVGYYENSGEGLGHYFSYWTNGPAMRGAGFGRHFGPHDVEHRRQGIEAKSIKQMAKEVGFIFETVERNPDKLAAIMNVRNVLPSCNFDEVECAVGIGHMEAFCREWDDKHGVWKSYPRHDAASHGADGFQTFADGYKPSNDNTIARIKSMQAAAAASRAESIA
ncbi:terminase [Devosia sp. A8/3-2]|nr:terminase [Devosia sp. A8/3-2]